LGNFRYISIAERH